MYPKYNNNKIKNKLKDLKIHRGWVWWVMSVIPVTCEAEVGRSWYETSLIKKQDSI
jgi:hypothetical protein